MMLMKILIVWKNKLIFGPPNAVLILKFIISNVQFWLVDVDHTHVNLSQAHYFEIFNFNAHVFNQFYLDP